MSAPGRGTSGATPPGPSPAERHVLDNGLVVLTRATEHAPVATLWVWYRVGSRNEVAGRTGVSHWVEHMLFKGSSKFAKGEIDRRIAREGGVFNAMTWIDWTAYYETLPADRIGLAIELEADRMSTALFDPEEVDSERTVVISECEGAENSPGYRLGEEVQSSAIKAHPYHHQVIGWKSDLKTMTRDDLVAHYRRHYHPRNAVAVAVGAFDPAEMLGRISDAFGGIPAGEQTAPATTEEPTQAGERRVTVRGEDEIALVQAAYLAPRASDDDYFAFQVLDTVLGGAKSMNVFGGNPPNRSSRLYGALVDAELASQVSSGMAATIDPFLYTVSAVVRAGQTGDACEAAIRAEVDRIREQPLTESELARAKKQARAQFAYSAESVSDQGFWLGFAEMVADQAWFHDHMARIDAVTAEDVARVAATYLDPDRCTVGRYEPKGATEVRA